MENDSSKEYVAKLLKQLEELKRKKAQKEKQLQKLKSDGHVKKKSRRVSHGSFHKPCNQLGVENDSDSVSSDYNCHKGNSSSLSVPECAKSIKAEKHAESCSKSSIISTDISPIKRENNRMNYADLHSKDVYDMKYTGEACNTEKNDCKQFNKSATHAVLSSIDQDEDRDKENSFINHNVLSHGGGDFSDVECYFKVNDQKCNENVSLHEEQRNKKHEEEHDRDSKRKADMDSSVIITNDVALDNSICDDSKKDCLKKSLSATKNDSSDIFSDSLNLNMSCFLSSKLFPDDLSQDILCKDKAPVQSVSENIREELTAAPKLSLSEKKQQNNLEDFNLPKFSTPTDGINFLSSSDGNIDEQNKSAQQYASAVKTVSSTELISSCNDNIETKSSFDPSKIISKGLSSVLDAHFVSPNKSKREIPSTINNEIVNSHCKTSLNKNFSKNNTNVHIEEQMMVENTSKGLSSVLDAHFISPDKSKNDIPSNINNEITNSHCKTFLNKNFLKNNTSIHIEEQMMVENTSKGLSSVLDAHFVSPGKSKNDIPSNINNEITNSDCKTSFNKNFSKNNIDVHIEEKMMVESTVECDKDVIMDDLFDDVQSQVTKTVGGLVNIVCEDSETVKISPQLDSKCDKSMMADSEILVIPETENLGLYFSENVEEFMETSTLSESLNDFHSKDNFLNVSSQSRLESPVVNRIVSAVKSARNARGLNDDDITFQPRKIKEDRTEDHPNDKILSPEFDSVSQMEASFNEDDTQELGNYKQVPYMNKSDSECNIKYDCEADSDFSFIGSLYGVTNEAVLDVEVIVFGNVKYAFIQHRKEIHVWQHKKKKQWIKIFKHQIDNTLSLTKICWTRDENYLVIVMLLSNGEQFCLQFLLFEKDVKVIKLMENTHWLDKRHSGECVLLCGLSNLIFASAQPNSGSEVSIHAFLNLKDSPRLMTAVLGNTDTTLYSLCKINNLPNALLGINDSMLYVWHILEARLVTAVPLHPHDYLPIKSCFWATVENGLIYMLTICSGPDKHLVCQLLAANLATGFCQTAMKYSSQPSKNNMAEVHKALYMEPYLMVCNSEGVLMWSVTDEHCCAALSKSGTTSVAMCSDFLNWGFVSVGSKLGCITCYALK